jgi:photosystem II stability/assembly factor-like uncharacterized protein
MQATEREKRLSARRQRALTLMAIALVAIVITGVAYLRPELAGLAKYTGLRPVPPPKATPGQPLLSNEYIVQYQFLTMSLGWALVSEQTSSRRFWIFKTTDGAKHWLTQLAATAPSVYNGSLQLRFFDRDNGLVSLADPLVIYRTSDGGSRWTPLKFPAYVSASADFSDAMHGWIFGYTGPADRLASQLSYTSDGGDTWRVLPQVPTFPLGGKGGAFTTNIAFRSPIEGWLGGAEAPGGPVVYSSVDGGVTWQRHPLPVPASAQPVSPKGEMLAAETAVYLIPGAGVMAVTADDQGNTVGLTSFDGGSTWRRLSPPPGETTFNDYVFQDTFHWWTMRYGTLFKSPDAGQSWKEVAQEMDEWDYLPGIIDSRHAWAQLQVVFPNTNPPQGTGLAMSSDGGVRWTPVNVPKPV